MPELDENLNSPVNHTEDTWCRLSAQSETARRRLLDTLWQHGYNLLHTPFADYTDNFKELTNIPHERSGIKMPDISRGKTLSLRTDHTPQVMLHYLYHSELSIQRYSYCGTIISNNKPQPWLEREAMQIGIECIGIPSLLSQTEIVYLANLSLTNLGITNLHLDLGNSMIIDKLLAHFNLVNPSQVATLKTIIANMDTNSLVAELSQYPQATECILCLIEEPHQPEKLCQFITEKLAAKQELLEPINRLMQLQTYLQNAAISTSINLCELGSHAYHNEFVFAIYNQDSRLIQGGSYLINIPKHIKQTKPYISAAGFSMNLNNLSNKLSPTSTSTVSEVRYNSEINATQICINPSTPNWHQLIDQQITAHQRINLEFNS